MIHMGIGSVGGWWIKITFCVYCVQNGPWLVDYNRKLMCKLYRRHTCPRLVG